ncbi:hypothetical protein NEUTE1DRAFT_144053 [Neurospora tetrasperma FGSC 2508]|uniref:COP9 signalosome complex subunit 3 n=1 Tax=Neurospora tetrasperma (strain FGSC 2508 / ATCC MYA-4615 / P0657) TaxID=510951 RepID=F8MDN5_NEUT8|nr:uncharacterized protein NEUTE1DRAFT_144053 [Neurospora tetrasperma FGSC 2508]EGO60673.1 hypothetical protein NEUTE1DRAFT_144053 [Neurospora tetrasperma FGSC 2508]EGZ75345.1 Signalosome subunit 3 [Neurospora tetrasperma FGSC 2509]
MDARLTVLTAFPPAAGIDNEEYYQNSQQHAKRVRELIRDNAQWIRESADDILKHVNPAVYSLSYLMILEFLLQSPGWTSQQAHESLASYMAHFLLQFDARQIRCKGSTWSDVLKEAYNERGLFPASVAVELVTAALLRLDPSGSIITSHHCNLVELAYNTGNVGAILPLIEKPIIYMPAKGMSTAQPLCDMSLPPPAYINPDSQLTDTLTSAAVLQYDFLCGLCFIERRMWQQAFDAFERCVTYPTRDGGCSKIMTEAYNKWVLVGLLLTGKPPTLPETTSQAAKKIFATQGKPYKLFAQAFKSETAGDLVREFEVINSELLPNEGNVELAKLVLAHYQRWQIINLRNIYTNISLEKIRERTQSAETGAPLPTVEAVDQLVQSMIADGSLQGAIERPKDGSPAYLTFLSSPAQGMSEVEFSAQVNKVMQGIKALEPIIEATNKRLASNREYISHTVKRQFDAAREHKLGLQSTGGGFEESSFHIEEEEDLMSGLPAH